MILAPVASASACGETPKTECGAPAAAHTSVERHEIGVHERFERRERAERRDAADGESGDFPHRGGVDALKPVADLRLHRLLVDAVGARDEEEHRLAARRLAENQRFDDLRDLGAAGGRRLLGRARALRHGADFDREAGGFGCGLDPIRASHALVHVDSPGIGRRFRPMGRAAGTC